MGSGESTCLEGAHLPPNDESDIPGAREPKYSDRSLEDMQLSPRELDPSGYKYVFLDQIGLMFKLAVLAIPNSRMGKSEQLNSYI